MKDFVKEWRIHFCSLRESWADDGEGGRCGLQSSRTTTFFCATRAKYHRSTLDSKKKKKNHPNRHAPQQDLRQNQSSNPFQYRVKINDSGCWEHRIMWSTRDGTPKRSGQYVYRTGALASSTARAGVFLHKGREANQQFIKFSMDLSILESVIKKGRPHGHRHWQEAGRQGILFGQQVEEKVQEEILPRCPWHFFTRWTIPRSNDWKWPRRRCLSTNGMLLQMKIIPTNPSRIFSLQEYLVAYFKQDRFQYFASGAQIWLQNKALSTLQQLEEEEEEEVAFYKRPRTFAEINNGHWVLLLLHEGVGKVHGGVSSDGSHDGDEPSTDRPRWLGIQVFGTILQGMILLNSITLLKMDRLQLTAVHCHRRRCKYHISVNVFPRCKIVHMMVTGRGDDQLIQYDNMLELGTSYKLKLGPKVDIGHECVVTMHDADTNDNMFTIVHDCVVTLHDACTNDKHDHFHWLPHFLSVSSLCLVLSCLYIVKRTRTVAQVMSLHTILRTMFMWAFPVTLCSPCLLHALPAAFLPFPPALEVRRLRSAAHSAQTGYGLVWRVPLLHRMIRCEKERRISNVAENVEKHSIYHFGMFLSVTMESAVFMGKNYLNN